MSAVMAPEQATARRRHRAAVAARVLSKAPALAAALDWDMLDSAPAWLGAPEPALVQIERRVGAVLCAPALRLWIDAARVAAVRAAVGEGFLRALLALPDLPAIASAHARPKEASPAQLAGLLQAAGGSVLLASLPEGPLRAAACAVLAPCRPLSIDAKVALALIARARMLAKETGR